MEVGSVVTEGEPTELTGDERVRKAYLGAKKATARCVEVFDGQY